jgi:hypothetical protein
MRITRCQANTLASKRDGILHHLGTLVRLQETRACHPPQPSRHRPIISTKEEVQEVLACEFCHSTLHLTTECPNTPDLVYDQAETRPCARHPGKRLDTPALWRSLHQATLQYLVTNVINYFRVLHNLTKQRQNLLRLITQLLDLPTSPTAIPIPYEPVHQSTLFDQAVTELVTNIASSPFPIRSETNPLLHTLCERYYSPIFGRSIDEYREEVYSNYHLQNGHHR